MVCPLPEEVESVTLIDQVGLLREMGFGLESEPPHTTELVCRREHRLKEVAFVARDRGVREAADA